MEFRTKADFDKFAKGNEEFLSKKTQAGKFELFTCNKCLSHFDDKKERNDHIQKEHDLTFDDVSAGQLGDSDYRGGGSTFEDLICDLCDQKKISEFAHFKNGSVSCSDCQRSNA